MYEDAHYFTASNVNKLHCLVFVLLCKIIKKKIENVNYTKKQFSYFIALKWFLHEFENNMQAYLINMLEHCFKRLISIEKGAVLMHCCKAE